MEVYKLGLAMWLSQLLMLLCWSLLVSSEVVCESSGTCLESSSRCQCDSLPNCYSVVADDHQYASYVPGTEDGLITYAGRGTTTCEKKTGQTSANRTDITIESIRLRYVSISPKYLAVCVSWSLSQSSGSSGGLVVQSVNEWNTARYCVTNSSTREICINKYQYGTLQRLEYSIQVYPFPLEADDDTEAFQKSQRIRSLTGCSDADSSVGTCGPKTYKAPINVTVLSRICDEGKDLTVSWQPPSGAEPIPHVYYVSIYVSRRRWKFFQVINSSQITLKNLSVNVNYSVDVRAYGKCAGLGNYYTSSGSCGTNQLGCGRPTSHITEAWVDCPSATINPSMDPENTTSISEDISAGDAGSNTHIVAVSVVIACVLVLIIALAILAVAVCVFKWHSSEHVAIYPKLPEKKPVAFVFYSPSMCESRLKSLQEHIVCLLLEYFEVVTPDDISSGNISMWLEDTVKSVDSILMVANKEFCCDWSKSKDERSPVMNSLELLISSAAAQNSIGKFCFVSPEDILQDVFVPDHSYLKLMPVFLLGKKNCDIDKLYQFVTKSRGIEFSNET